MLWDKVKRHFDTNVFRSITVLDPVRMRSAINIHFTKNKTILKECHTTIQRHDVIHNTYPLYLSVHQVHMLRTVDIAHTHQQACSLSQYTTLSQKQLRLSNSFRLHSYIREKLQEERRYFQSHPYQARQLARSYVQTSILRSALRHFVQTTNRYTSHRQPKPLYLHRVIAPSQLHEVMSSQIDQVAHEMKQPSLTAQPVPLEPIVSSSSYVNEETLIRRIVKEVLRRLRQDRQREGR